MTTALDNARANLTRLTALGGPAALLEHGPERLAAGTGLGRVMISRLDAAALTPVSLWSAGRAAAVPALTVALGYPLVEAELARRPGAQRVELASAGRRSPEALRDALGWASYAVATITVAGTPVGLLHAEPEADRVVGDLDVELVALLATGFGSAFEVASLREALAAHRDVQRATIRQLSATLGQEDDDGSTAATPEGAASLTDREQEVLEGLARGRTNRQLAEELVISEATVKYHVRNLLRKLGATSRTEAVARRLSHPPGGADGRHSGGV